MCTARDKARQLLENKATVKHFPTLLSPVNYLLSSSPLVRKFHLVAMSQILQELIYFVSEASEKLTWSFGFHKNYLFGKGLMVFEKYHYQSTSSLWCGGSVV